MVKATVKRRALVLLLLTVSTWACDTRPAQQYRFQKQIRMDGLKRSYLLNLPPQYYEVENLPLVVALHGTGGSALQCERDYGLTTKANEMGYVIVYPEGVPRPGPFQVRTWNAGKCCDYAMTSGVDDVKFIRSMIEELKRNYKIDSSRIYFTGMSNGAMLVYRIACEMPEYVRAIAPVSGTLMTRTDCSPSNRIPILHIHSIHDDIIPYHGGTGLAGYHFSPVDSALQVWTALNQCGSVIEEDFEKYNYIKYTCTDGISIERYLTRDGGHAWPGGLIARPGADQPSTAIKATDVIWDFFERVQ